MMETSPNSPLGSIFTYNGLSKKVNILGSTVANPYMAVCLNRFLYKLKVGALLVSNKNSHYIHSKKKERTFVHAFPKIYGLRCSTINLVSRQVKRRYTIFSISKDTPPILQRHNLAFLVRAPAIVRLHRYTILDG